MLEQLVNFFSTYADAILAFAVVGAGVVYLARLGLKINHNYDSLSKDIANVSKEFSKDIANVSKEFSKDITIVSKDIANVSKDLAEVKSLIGTLIKSTSRQNERIAHLEGRMNVRLSPSEDSEDD